MDRGWQNGFYRKLWSDAGLQPGDIRSIDDITRLPLFNSDDIKDSQKENPPFGDITGIDYRAELARNPLKVQSSGGTTGKPRPTMFGALEWEMNGLQVARSLYIQGARPGHVMQIPATCSLANLAWAHYHACHNYLGILPITTGSGVVTPSLRQVEIAFDYGTNILMSFPEYLTQLAKVACDDYGRNISELGLSFIPTYLGPDTDGVLRRDLEAMFGCPVYDNYGTNEISHAAFEGPDKDGLYLMEDAIYLEVVDTETGKPVDPLETWWRHLCFGTSHRSSDSIFVIWAASFRTAHPARSAVRFVGWTTSWAAATTWSRSAATTSIPWGV